MSVSVPLRLRPLINGGLTIQRSAIRWLCADSQAFKPGDVLGYCNIVLVGRLGGQGDFGVSGGEGADLQVALIARAEGRLEHAESIHGGGWADRQAWYLWEPDTILANMVFDGEISPEADRLVDFHFVTGRRAVAFAEDRSGLATGWHVRNRAWTRAGEGRMGTLLGLGTCELFTMLRDDGGVFLDLVEHAPGRVQVVDVPDRYLLHSARMLVEQLSRTDEQMAEIESEFRQFIGASVSGGGAGDWIFAGLCLQRLQSKPTRERYDILTGDDIETVGPADAIVLSINSEETRRLRHKRLGFALDFRTMLIPSFGPDFLNWLKVNFEWVDNTPQDIRRDLLELAELVRKDNPDVQILVVNAVSTTKLEAVLSYSAYDEPLGQSLKTVRAKELNCMLDELAHEANFAIVDADAIAARLGGSICIPDGIHQNGQMQHVMRREILSILSARKVPGFSAEEVRRPQTILSAQQ